jgi:hypothetical protein
MFSGVCGLGFPSIRRAIFFILCIIQLIKRLDHFLNRLDFFSRGTAAFAWLERSCHNKAGQEQKAAKIIRQFCFVAEIISLCNEVHFYKSKSISPFTKKACDFDF